MIDLSAVEVQRQFDKRKAVFTQAHERVLDLVKSVVFDRRRHYVNPRPTTEQTLVFAVLSEMNPVKVIPVTIGAKRAKPYMKFGVPIYNPNQVRNLDAVYYTFDLALVDMGGVTLSEQLRIRTGLVRPDAVVLIS